MKRKTLSLILALALCLALCSPAMAVNFSDLSGHWSKTYIDDLVSRNFLAGYSDGTIRPDASITVIETLSLLSRFYSPTAAELEFIAEDYESMTKAALPGTMDWAYDEVEVCLAAGIVKSSELKTLDYSKPIQKQQLALFLVRAIQKQSEAEALSTSTETYFEDADSISADCYGSVVELYKLGIVKGDENNRFLPKAETARGVVAAMVSRSLDYLTNNSTVLTIKSYTGLSRVFGVITAADSGSVQLRGSDGLVREYKFTGAATVTVNGVAKTLSSTYVGDYASVTIKSGAVSAIAITNDNSFSIIQGVTNTVNMADTTGYIGITNSVTNRSNSLVIPSTAKITVDGKSTIDGKTVGLNRVARNSFVTARLKDGNVVSLDAVSSEFDVKGEITELKFGANVSMKLMDDAGTTYVFSFDIAYPPKITRGTTVLSVDRLSVGSSVIVGVKNCVAQTIRTEGNETSVTGELSSITSTASSTQWTLSVNGSPTTLTLDKNVGVYSGKTSILLSDIHAGDTVTVYYYGSVITEVYLVNATNSSSKLTGSVLSTTTSSSNTITILSGTEKIVYANLNNVSYIINASTGRTMSLSKITEGSQLTIFGSYKDSSTFQATLVVVEVLQ